MVNSATIGRIKVFIYFFWCSTIHLLLKYHRRVIRIYMYITALIFNNQSADHEDTYCVLLCVWMCVLQVTCTWPALARGRMDSRRPSHWNGAPLEPTAWVSRASWSRHASWKPRCKNLFSICSAVISHLSIVPFRAVLLHRSLSHLPHRRKQSALVMFDKLPSER